ncbi:hypothetical protein [Pontiella agarivorans]|uniref:Uncharacterized protein n=1 Tax=Pontiella agarivorans TaxID=3038953 RepID=A0ABU5MYS5_9BACT|nr:hypothetical protein [Pontiella agarivorans]MDZ8119365.1 hypothetical protein [Pontiella agarivorans]
MKTTKKYDTSINEILTAMGIHDLDRNLPPKKNLRKLNLFADKKGSGK